MPRIIMLEDKDRGEILEKETINLNSKHPFWTETLLSKFSFKCLMNKQKLCNDLKCQCLYHQKKEKETEYD